MTDSFPKSYKAQILHDFNNRVNYENEFHRRASTRLVERVNLQPGDVVLDVATGTGLVAIATSELVGSTSSVLGTDFALGMLQHAQRKADALGLTNIAFKQVDADEQELPVNYYDAIFCSCAIAYFRQLQTVLQRWYEALKPGGIIAFSCFAETSLTTSSLFRAVVQQYGVTIPNPHQVLGTP